MPVAVNEEEDATPGLIAPRKPRNRLLNPPKMHYIPKLSLPQLLANYAKPRDKPSERDFGVVPGSVESSAISPGGPGSLGSRKSLKRKGTSKSFGRSRTSKSDFASEAPSMETDASGWPVIGGGLGGYKKAQELFAIDTQLSSRKHRDSGSLWANIKPGTAGSVDEECDFVKKRREHPRLRWPRLASRGNTAESNSEGLEDGLFGTEQLSTADKQGDRPGSTSMFKPSSAQSLVSGSSSSRAKSAGKDAITTRPKIDISRPAILPRVRSKAAIRPGTASTFHGATGDEHVDFLDDYMHNSQTSFFSVGSVSNAFSVGDQSSSLSTEGRIDRKWFMRMTPISCLPSEPNLKAARRAHAEVNGPVKGDAGEYLSFKRWGINDDYIDALLAAHCESTARGLSGVHYLNLSENQLTEHGVAKLLTHGLTESLSLNLAQNRLGHRGGLAVASVVEQCKHLADLDLSGNPIGDAALEQLCNVVEFSCRDLEGLGLAECNLGTSPRANDAGEALARLVSTSKKLKSLDLHWNMLNSSGMHAFLSGLYENGTNGLVLRQLNLAWNRLGSGHRSDELRKQDALRSAKLLASVFCDGEVLFHLDLSYNGFDAEECEILAKGLKDNHTLFGLHLLGNEATIDDLGFVAPIARPAESAPTESVPPGAGVEGQPDATQESEGDPQEVESLAMPAIQAEEHRVRLNGCVRSVPCKLRLHAADLSQPRGRDQENAAYGPGSGLRTNPSLQSLVGDGATSFSEGDLNTEQRWVADRSKVQPVRETLGSLPDALERNCKCCWICENWVEHRVCYIPGLSGPERHPDQVQSVHAFYSIDGFSRPTKLSKSEETSTSLRHSVKLSQDVMSSLMASTAGGAALPMLGRAGSNQAMLARRMSRRTSRAAGMSKIIKWVGVRMLPPTMEMMEVIFLVDGKIQVATDCRTSRLAVPKTINLRTATSEEGPPILVQVSEVNLIPAGVSFWEAMQNGMPRALCVLEDPANRHEATVFPRKLAEVTQKAKAKTEWTFETSVFKDYRRDNPAECEKCFDTDWSNSRLNQILKEPALRKNVQDYMRPRYLSVMLCFMQQAFTGFEGKIHAAGLGFNGFREWLVQAGGCGPGKLIDGTTCKMNDPDCIFIAANVIEKSKRKDFKVMPEKGLARFQFNEGWLRMAFRRYLSGSAAKSQPEELAVAAEKLMDCVQTGQEMVKMRTELHTALFTEECCMVYRDHMDTLKGVYESYKMVSCYPGRIGKNMSFGAWMEFCEDADIVNEDFNMRNVGLAFALAKEIRADVTSDWRHMELSFPEFIVALGALLTLRKDFNKEFLADMLEEMFCDNLATAQAKGVNKKAGKARGGVNCDPSLAPLVAFLTRMFEDADDDGSGTVDLREFRRVFSQPEYKAEMSRLGVNVSELEMLFRALDKDGSGELGLQDLCNGFIKMKQAMKGLDRAISYIKKAFSEVDEDGSGTLDMEEFRNLFEQPGVVRKLNSLGISTDDVTELLTMTEDKDGDGVGDGVSVQEIIENFVKLRDPKNAGLRGVRLLAKLFELADADGSGELSKEEVQEAFGGPDLAKKLQDLRLRVPDWSTLFEELDLDGSGGLDWEELEDGMKAFWAKDALS